MGGVGSRPVEQSVFMPAAKTLAIILNVRLLGRSRPDRQSCCKGATVTPARLLVESHDTSRLRGEPATGWQETEQGVVPTGRSRRRREGGAWVRGGQHGRGGAVAESPEHKSADGGTGVTCTGQKAMVPGIAMKGTMGRKVR